MTLSSRIHSHVTSYQEEGVMILDERWLSALIHTTECSIPVGMFKQPGGLTELIALLRVKLGIIALIVTVELF